MVTTLAVALLTWRDGEMEERQRLRRSKRDIHYGDLNDEFSLTSIFLPSTIVPLSFSLARSASLALSKVTNPKPCGSWYILDSVFVH